MFFLPIPRESGSGACLSIDKEKKISITQATVDVRKTDKQRTLPVFYLDLPFLRFFRVQAIVRINVVIKKVVSSLFFS